MLHGRPSFIRFLTIFRLTMPVCLRRWSPRIATFCVLVHPRCTLALLVADRELAKPDSGGFEHDDAALVEVVLDGRHVRE